MHATSARCRPSRKSGCSSDDGYPGLSRPWRKPLQEALRAVATDQQRELRAQALELLAIDSDAYAQELLMRGLREPKNALVPEAQAIQLLGYDDHAQVVPLVREVYERATGATREEALRVLARIRNRRSSSRVC